jgi:hypothetical protein
MRRDLFLDVEGCIRGTGIKLPFLLRVLRLAEHDEP